MVTKVKQGTAVAFFKIRYELCGRSLVNLESTQDPKKKLMSEFFQCPGIERQKGYVVQ